MKKIPSPLIVLWIVFPVIGILLVTVGLLALSWNGALCWSLAGVLWGGTLIWFLLYLLLGGPGKKKAKVAFAGNQAIYQRISKETREAINRFLKTVTSKGFLKKDVLYEKPWFLLCGTRKSGKTALLKGSGLVFPQTYPSESDGMFVEGGTQATYYFANEAVWIDTPGSLMDDNSKDEWKALAASLCNERSSRPVDGVAIVVNAHEIMNSDDIGIRDTARVLRARLDEVIALWGIEFPVYLIFNHADEIPGFREYFGDLSDKAHNQILGATMKVGSTNKLPRLAFNEEFSLLCRALTDARLDRLGQERTESNKRMICRFVIHFEGMQEKLGQLAGELFKPSNYVGKPIFRGFYFTSCREMKNNGVMQEIAQPAQDIGQTITNHPLNPRRALPKDNLPASGGFKPSAAAVISSVFVLPLFRKIMVRDKSLAKNTQQRSRKELFIHYGIVASILAVATVLGFWFANASHDVNSLLSKIKIEMTETANTPKNSLVDHYAALEVMRSNISELREFDRKPLRFSWGFYRGKKVLKEMCAVYGERSRPLIIDPVTRYLEYQLTNTTSSFGELTGEQYTALYSSLKTYLSFSEAIAGKPQDIDTTFLSQSLFDALSKALMSSTGQARLPEQLEIVLRSNISLVCYYLKNGEYPLFQANQRMVADARSRLQRLPNAQTLYETVINRLAGDAPQRNLDELLSRQGEGILKSSATISVLFTQQGFDQYVNDGISQAAKNPYSIDWVLGITKDEVPAEALDTRALKEEMIAVYLLDCKKRWLDFMASITMDPFGDLDRSSRMLQKLAAGQSELETVMTLVGNATIIKPTNEAEDAAGKALKAGSQFKGTKKLAKQIDKSMDQAEKAAGTLGFGMGGPTDQLAATFDPLRAFVRSSSSLGGFQGYRDKLLSLAAKAQAVKEQGEQTAVSVFNGRDDDPLVSSWRSTQNDLTAMPAELSQAMQGLLLLPIRHTGDAVAIVLTKTLNTSWQNEIIKPYTSRFTGRYPFAPKGDEASFTDVMDFFRPNTGTFWGYYDRVLSPYVVKTSNGWMVRQLGSITLSFNPKLANALMQAERIRDIFFKPDGTLRAMSVAISQASNDNNTAKLDVNGQSYDLTAGKTVQFVWPVDVPSPRAVLHISTGKTFVQDISCNGSWGLLKLLAQSRINVINAATFTAKWQVNVQNTYTIQINYKVQVAGNDHPFAERIFEAFDIPTDLMIAPVVKTPGAIQ